MSTATVEADKPMDLHAAAGLAGVKRDTLWGWIKHGCVGVRLRARMVGGHWRVTAADLEQFYADRTAAALGRVADEQAACGAGSAVAVGVGTGGGEKARGRGLKAAQERLRRRGL